MFLFGTKGGWPLMEGVGDGAGAAGAGNGAAGATGDGGAKPWYGEVAPEVKGVIEMKGWSGAADIVQSYTNLEKLAKLPADRLVQLPSPLAADADDASKKAYEAEFGKVYDRLGRPAKPEDYKITAKDDGVFMKEATSWMHEIGLNTKQAQTLAAKWEKYSGARAAQAQTAHEADITKQADALRGEWGAAFEKNKTVAGGAMQMLGLGKEQVDALEQALGYGGVMKFLHTIGTKIGEDKFISGDSAMRGAMSPDEARARVAALKNDGAWVAKYLAGGVAEVEEMTRLLKFAGS